jgi:ABC-2 type transport system permease protein
MSFSRTRTLAIFHKELREYRRNRLIVVTMVILPVIFIAIPIVLIFTASHSESSTQLENSIGAELLFMLVIPAMIPSTLASYSVVGERDQGTLEPVLTTPIRSEEFAIGKALAVLVPTLVISYVAFLVYLACALFAHPSVTSAVFGSSHLLILLLFTPLLASWSIWAGIAISTRSSDVRVAQSLGTFASFPPFILTALILFNVIPQTFGSILGLVAALLLFASLGWRLVSAMFNRERLVSGTRS